MPETTIGRAQAPIKLYDVNRNPPIKDDVAIVRYSPDGRSVTLAMPEIKRQAACEPSMGFWDQSGTSCYMPADRATFCAKPIRLASRLCEVVTDCSPRVVGQKTQSFVATNYFAYSYISRPYYAHYELHYAIGSSTYLDNHIVDNYIATLQSYLHHDSDGNTRWERRDCPTVAACPLGQFIEPTNVAYLIDPVVDIANNCAGTVPVLTWVRLVRDVDSYCNYVAPTQATAQAAIQAQAPIEAFNNVTSVEELPANSQALLTSHAQPSPSALPVPSANSALGLLGFLAVAPIGLGIVAVGVGAYGLYKWCYPDKVDQDTDENQIKGIENA